MHGVCTWYATARRTLLFPFILFYRLPEWSMTLIFLMGHRVFPTQVCPFLACRHPGSTRQDSSDYGLRVGFCIVGVCVLLRVRLTGVTGTPCDDRIYRSVCRRRRKRLICLMPAPRLTPSLACPASRPSLLPLLSGLEECTKGQSIPRMHTDLQ